VTDRKTRLAVERLESRTVPAGLVRVAPVDPFLGNPADDVPSQPGVNYPFSQVEPYVAANPTRANNLVAAWQQDRWSNGGARGVVVGVSTDHGHSWDPVVIPGITKVAGGEFLRATDPWLAFAADGDLFASVLAWDPAPPDHPILQYPFDSTRSAVFVARSADGGLTWDQPVKLIDEPGVRFEGPLPFLAFNDKETITADPTDPDKAYVVWTRISFDPLTGFRGPTYLSRTTDGGATWEAPRPIHDPGPFAQTIANQVLVLPDGTLVNVFTQGSEASRFGDVAAVRSTDGGLTWSAPAIIATAAARLVTNPDDGGPIRTGETFVEAAVDPRTGAVYLVTQALDLADGRALEGVTFSQSLDGGRTWTEPVVINGTPTGIPAGSRQAFNPSVHVAADGTVAVTYYDFRKNTPDAGLPTDYWAVFADPGDRRNRPGGLADPTNWGGEVRLTDESFDMERAPSSQNENAGYFVGDYQGLTAVGNRFLAVFSVAGTEG